MSFLLEKKLETGVLIQFWKIEKVYIDVNQSYVDVSFQGYLNQDEFAKGSLPVVSTSVRFDQDLGAKVMTDFLNLCENILVNTGEYTGGQIVG